MARLAPLAFLLAALLSVLAIGTPTAHADGKVFLSIASDPSGSASATMPRQRAIIAFKDGVQRMAIDTSFVGPGEEFAWLVPLPSEPEILPATKGMFDTAAMITGPRVTGRKSVVAFPALILGFALFGIALNLRRWQALILIVVMLLFLAVFLPALSKARSLPASLGVDVRSEKQVGVYDTVVLSADDSSDLIRWLDGQGYAAPNGVESVIQSYLDRGWVFAAAKLRDESGAEGERRAHPLQFHFDVEQPVYPMALTAVGNESIDLDLFVFADGSASTRGLTRVTSFGAQPDNRGTDDRYSRAVIQMRPATIAHPGLIDLAEGLSWVTRLHGVLTPAQQRSDLAISVADPKTINPLLHTPAARRSKALSTGAWVASGVGMLWLLLAGFSHESRERTLLPKRSARWPWLIAILGAGLLTAGGVYIGTPMYRGELSRGYTDYRLERDLEEAAVLVEVQAIEQSARTPEEIEAIRTSVFEDLDIDPQSGDSPLHYRIEFNDDETEAQFIWHDLIGAEHRVVIPLVSDSAGDEPAP